MNANSQQADKDSIRSKIAKLLAVAQDGRGNEFEEEAALRQAEKLMRKHNIDVAELQDRTGTKPIYNWKSVMIPAGAPLPVKSSPLWFGMLISAIGRFTDCKVAYANPGYQYGICAKFSGDEVDVEYAGWLCKHLRDHVRSQSRAFVGSKADRESFRKAFCLRIDERMRALLKERKAALEAAKTSTGTALVVVTEKLALRDAEFGVQTYAKPRRFGLRSDGAAAGRSAADRANFNRPLSGQQQARLA